MSKINALPAYATPVTTDVMPIVDLTGPTTKKVTLAAILALTNVGAVTGVLPIANGGSGASTLVTAQTALGIGAYSEGTWATSDQSGAGLTLTNTYTPQWRRVGNLIFASFAIVYPATASGLGAVLGTLPFTTSAAQFPVTLGFHTFGSSFQCFTQASATTIFFFTNAGVQITNANFSGLTIRGSAAYFV